MAGFYYSQVWSSSLCEINVKPTVNLMPCYIKHIARCLQCYGTKAQQVYVHHIIKKNSLDVAQSHIQPKKRGNKNRRGIGKEGEGAEKLLKKGGVRNIGGSS